MTDFQIFCDSREKKPYHFSRYPSETEEKRLLTGDYVVSGDGVWIDAGFDPDFAVERKNPDDFLQSITWERDRFEDELRRADSFSNRMPIIVEKPWEYFEQERYRRDVHLNSIKATIESHSNKYNVEYFFTRDRKKAAHLTYEYLEWRAGQLNSE